MRIIKNLLPSAIRSLKRTLQPNLKRTQYLRAFPYQRLQGRFIQDFLDAVPTSCRTTQLKALWKTFF